MRLGIDFGTTRTVVSTVNRGRYPVISFETPDGFADYVPTVTALAAGQRHYGWNAIPSFSDSTSNVLRSIKQRVGRLAPDELAAADATALELATGFASYLHEALLTASNLEISPGEPLEVMLAVPANAATRQRYLTLEAFKRAGFHVIGLISEPSAAAIEYAHRNIGVLAARSPKRYIVVYDLGGGTFDTAAVSLEGRRFDLICSEGIAELGGNDFDALVLEIALERLGSPPPIDEEERTRLLEVCRVSKEGLAPTTRRVLVELEQVLEGTGSVVVDTRTLYDRSLPLIDATLELVDRVFARLLEHGIDPENSRELGAVYLVGGASAFVPVNRALRQRFKRKLALAPHPHAATAIGLALAADTDAQLFVREAVTRHFGVWREAESGYEKIFDPIFEKHEQNEDELVAERVYEPRHAVGHLRFMECSELACGRPSGDMTPWGDILFPYDPALAGNGAVSAVEATRRCATAGQRIRELYRYLPDGRVQVEIANCSSGYARSFVLGRPSP